MAVDNQKFNSQQLKAITAPISKIIVIAGAGSGKTTVLINRIIHLIQEKNIDPKKILAVTFTNKAVEEINERISKESINLDYIGTFHKIAYIIIKQHWFDIKNTFVPKILDQYSSYKILKNIAKTMNIDQKIKFPVSDISSLITNIKNITDYPNNENFDWDENYEINLVCKELSIPDQHGFFLTQPQIKEIYCRYIQNNINENNLDYDDLILYGIYFLKHTNIQKYWDLKFDAILIDEFQDIEFKQWQFMKLLLGNKNNIFCVGDPDQTIYGWRGSNPEIFNDFRSDFPESEVIKLEENYRSTQHILNIANTLIKKNENHEFSKNLFTKNPLGEKVQYFQAKDEYEELNWVIEQLQTISRDKKIKLKNCMILYRSNSDSIGLETHLIKAKINYVKSKDTKFYDKSEVKTIISYLNLIFFDDSIALEYIINIPNRKLGNSTIQAIKQYSENKKIKFFYAIFNHTDELVIASSKKETLHQFIDLMQDIRKIPKNSITKLIEGIIQKIKYEDYLMEKAESHRLKNVKLLIEWLENIWNSKIYENLEDLISELPINSAYEKNYDNDNYVNLSTVHASKGLEFDYVFIIKMNETIFPNWRNQDIAEERRAFYVAVTRAKKQLFLTSSASKINLKDGKKRDLKISRFIEDILPLKDKDFEIVWKNLLNWHYYKKS